MPSWLARNRFCEVPREIHDCTFYSSQVHHIKGRKGPLLNDTRFWMAACQNGHTWIHDHPNEARKKGLLKF